MTPVGNGERWAAFSDDEVAVMLLALDASMKDGDFERAREEMLVEVTRELRRRISSSA